MERAKTLLQTTGLSVSEIAMESGYDNFSYFIRVFRQYFGVTPDSSARGRTEAYNKKRKKIIRKNDIIHRKSAVFTLRKKKQHFFTGDLQMGS